MVKILLISCNLAEEPYPVFPLGMTMVAYAAGERGHRVTLWDPLAEGKPLREAAVAARALRPDVIGISLRNIDNINAANLTGYVEDCRGLVSALREAVPGTPIVLGGAGFSLCAEPILKVSGADFGIVGEGEEAFCDLVEKIESGKASGNERILNGRAKTLADEDARGPRIIRRDPRLAAFYLKAGGMLNVQSKRGCPHRCAYCSYPALEDRIYRFRAPESVVDEIEYLKRELGGDYFAFTDSVFNDRQGHYLLIAEELARRDLRVPWMAFFRPQRFTREEAALLKRSGLACVEWGSDCATDTTLAAMRKDFTWADVEHSNNLFNECGIYGTHFIIFGGPGESEASVREGLANLDRLERCVVLAYCGVRILPGTQMRKIAVDEGVIDAEDDLLEAKFYLSPQVTREFLEQALSASFGTRIDRIWPPDRDLEKVKVFHQLGTRGPVWDLLLGRGGRERRRSR